MKNTPCEFESHVFRMAKRKYTWDEHKSFTFYVRDFNPKQQSYTLHNPYTDETKEITKEEFDILYEEQKRKGEKNTEPADNYGRIIRSPIRRNNLRK